jgi:flagellar M-ring protein FliF
LRKLKAAILAARQKQPGSWDRHGDGSAEGGTVKVLEALKGLGPVRLAAMAGVALATLGLLAFLATRGGQPMALLYADLDLKEAGQITDQLDKAHIAHQEDGSGSRIMVPADQVARARLLLAKEGLPSGGSLGYEIFDRGDGLTASQFQQNINETRALEGELARSIRMINGVRNVRVHLVLPKREPFAREKPEAQASVLLTTTNAGRMDREGVQAVLNLVAAAVPGLKPQNIAIVDNRGNVLARAGAPTGPAAEAQSTEEIRRATELRLSRAVEEMLERTLGPGRVRAEASVEMSFDQTRETQEKYDPDGQVVRSTQSVSDNSKSTEANQNVSVQNNLPNANAGQPEGAGSSEARQEETTNYEISKTVRTLVHDQPQIRRISLAVLVDGADSRAADGTIAWKERTPDELTRINALVKSAIGYDEKRGDHVEVVNLRFAGVDELPATESKGLLGLGLQKPDMMHLAEIGVFGLVAIMALLLVLRPMALRLVPQAVAAPEATALEALGPAGEGAAPGTPGAVAGAIAGPSGAPALTAPDGTPIGLLGSDEMVDVANIEGQMRASSLRRLNDLVTKHPEETLAIMRGWIVQEGN